MLLSVCIVNWNTREMLGRCIRSLYARTGKDFPFEVVVVDNASIDGSAAMIRRTFPSCTLLASDQNQGFARGCNAAARLARGKYVLFLNPDTELASDALAAMVACLEQDATIGAVGCRLVNSDGSIQFTCAGTFPSARNELNSLLCLDRLFPRSRLLGSRELNYWDHMTSADVDCLSGACMMLRRDLVERLGGFDEHLFMYGEDLDLCRRIQLLGYRLRYLASEIIVHHEGAGSRKRGSHFAWILQRQSNYYFLKKHAGSLPATAYRAAVSVGSAFRLCVAAALMPLLSMTPARHRIGVRDFFSRHVALLLWSLHLDKMRSRGRA
jgi:GT2 family glycosyltransferase